MCDLVVAKEWILQLKLVGLKKSSRLIPIEEVYSIEIMFWILLYHSRVRRIVAWFSITFGTVSYKEVHLAVVEAFTQTWSASCINDCVASKYVVCWEVIITSKLLVFRLWGHVSRSLLRSFEDWYGSSVGKLDDAFLWSDCFNGGVYKNQSPGWLLYQYIRHC